MELRTPPAGCSSNTGGSGNCCSKGYRDRRTPRAPEICSTGASVSGTADGKPGARVFVVLGSWGSGLLNSTRSGGEGKHSLRGTGDRCLLEATTVSGVRPVG